MSSQGRGSRGGGGPSRGIPGDSGRGRGGSRGGGGRGRGIDGGSGGGDGRGRGGPTRGGGGGRGLLRGGRGRGDFCIWQEDVQAVCDPQLQQKEDDAINRFQTITGDPPEFPLRMFFESDANSHFHRFVLKVLDGGQLANPA